MWKRRQEPEKPVRGSGLGDECEAFLAGEWVDHLEAEGLPVPSWAWLNRVAHAPEADLRAMTRLPAWSHTEMDEWSRLRACVAATVLDRAKQMSTTPAEMQRLVLVPIELRVCGDDRLQQLGNPELLIRLLGALHHPSAQSH